MKRTKDSITIRRNKKGKITGFDLTGEFANNFAQGLIKHYEKKDKERPEATDERGTREE